MDHSFLCWTTWVHTNPQGVHADTLVPYSQHLYKPERTGHRGRQIGPRFMKSINSKQIVNTQWKETGNEQGNIKEESYLGRVYSVQWQLWGGPVWAKDLQESSACWCIWSLGVRWLVQYPLGSCVDVVFSIIHSFNRFLNSLFLTVAILHWLKYSNPWPCVITL